MARPGDSIDNGNLRLTFRETSGSTGGERLLMEALYRPNSPMAPLHFHPKQTEQFTVVSGRLHFRVDGNERVVEAGGIVDIKPGVLHQAWNPTDQETIVHWLTRPALQTERFFETLFGLVKDGRTSSKGVPNLLQLAVINRGYTDEFVLASPPRIVQSCVFGLLAPIGRALGYRARYPQYSPD